MSAPEQSPMQDLAAAYALGALVGEEARAFEAWLRNSPEGQREVAEYREVAALLATQAAGAAPDPSLRRRMLERAAADKVAPIAGAGGRRTPLAAWLALAASLALAVWLGRTASEAREALATQAAVLDSVQAKLAGRESVLNAILEPGVDLTLLTAVGDPRPGIQLFWDRTKHVAIVHAFNLTPAPDGKEYQLWFIRAGEAPVPSITFNSAADGHALVPGVAAPEGAGFTHLAVTIEPAGGSPAPTSDIVLIGAVGAS